MKNVTLSADEHALERARAAARAQDKTLNQMFREWLEEVGSPGRATREYEALMRDIRASGFRLDKMPTREEMNDRS